MPRPRQSNPLESIAALAALAADFDYQVDPEDFIFYELALAIDEDRASLDDPEFQSLIDQGIHDHVSTNLAVRAALTGVFRAARPSLNPETQRIAGRLIDILEDLESDLRHAGVVAQSYTAYLIRQLEKVDDTPAAADELARSQIEGWREGRVIAEQVRSGLAALGASAAPAAADLLFDDPEDREATRIAVEALGRIRSPAAARALAHAVSEPMLAEDIEQLAYQKLRDLWPLPRPYMLTLLRRHEHEDLPVRWFQLFAESDEIETVERVLEEFTRHAADPAHREDLASILEFLRMSGDPDFQVKIVAALNDPELSQPGAAMLEAFLKTCAAPAIPISAGNPWLRQQRLAVIHKQYRAAAKLADTGRVAEAGQALGELLNQEPDYPFAVMLGTLVS